MGEMARRVSRLMPDFAKALRRASVLPVAVTLPLRRSHFQVGQSAVSVSLLRRHHLLKRTVGFLAIPSKFSSSVYTNLPNLVVCVLAAKEYVYWSDQEDSSIRYPRYACLAIRDTAVPFLKY
jgi:hypothetical protein